jgi:hypothetical protein
MAITVSGTTITFNDATTQSTAATAGSLVTTANVLNATAGASVGVVGTYALLYMNNLDLVANTYSAGATFAGSSLAYFGASVTALGSGYVSTVQASSASGPTGTWRLMGKGGRITAVIPCCGNEDLAWFSLFLRIS